MAGDGLAWDGSRESTGGPGWVTRAGGQGEREVVEDGPVWLDDNDDVGDAGSHHVEIVIV